MKNKDSSPLVSVFILNWNREKETQRAIESVLKQSYQNIEIIIVDNGSTDNSIKVVKENYPDIKLISLDKNYGCPGGRNRGLKHCNGEYIFFLDNDGVLHYKAVEYALLSIQSDPDVVVVTGQVYDYKTQEEIDTNFYLEYSKNNLEVQSFQGGISLHKKLIYDEIGKYPDDYMYGGEEQHLSFRILDYGKKIIKNKSIILWHKKSDFARDHVNEEIQAMLNTFVTYYEFLPLFTFVKFLFKYFTYYPALALRNRYVLLFLSRNLKEIPKRLKLTKRNPVDKKTISKRNVLPNFNEC